MTDILIPKKKQQKKHTSLCFKITFLYIQNIKKQNLYSKTESTHLSVVNAHYAQNCAK